MAAKDEDGRALEGPCNYKLHVPAKVPVQRYWPAVVYDRATHAPIRNVLRLSRSSQSQGLQSNSDGSADIYFGPKAPAGKEANWIPTSASGRFECCSASTVLTKTFFDKTWQLPRPRKSETIPERGQEWLHQHRQYPPSRYQLRPTTSFEPIQTGRWGAS